MSTISNSSSELLTPMPCARRRPSRAVSYDTYKMAIRWASDRIGDQGLVAFVTNGSWIDGNVDSGLRACLADEFTSIHVVNLRGNQRHPRRAFAPRGW